MIKNLLLPALLLGMLLMLPSCISKKKHFQATRDLRKELNDSAVQLGKAGKEINDLMNQLGQCGNEKVVLEGEIKTLQNNVQLREEQITDLKDQITDIRQQRDKQLNQVDDLTNLSQSASNNIRETLGQLEKKDQYIHLLQNAKSRADSINLALAVNLKGVLQKGIADEDVEVKVDKTVVFINLSDKMLFSSGSYELTSRANEVLGKIAQIVQSRPEFEVMVEGYTDNVPISRPGIRDNWDLSVLRSTSVVRSLQKDHGINPNRLIAAGRGEHNTLSSNDSYEGRQMNRRTRIIILPRLDQFYDLLDPKKVPK